MGSGAVAAWCRMCSGHSAFGSEALSGPPGGQENPVHLTRCSLQLSCKGTSCTHLATRGRGCSPNCSWHGHRVKARAFSRVFLLMVLAQRQQSRVFWVLLSSVVPRSPAGLSSATGHTLLPFVALRVAFW